MIRQKRELPTKNMLRHHLSVLIFCNPFFDSKKILKIFFETGGNFPEK